MATEDYGVLGLLGERLLTPEELAVARQIADNFYIGELQPMQLFEVQEKSKVRAAVKRKYPGIGQS